MGSPRSKQFTRNQSDREFPSFVSGAISVFPSGLPWTSNKIRWVNNHPGPGCICRVTGSHSPPPQMRQIWVCQYIPMAWEEASNRTTRATSPKPPTLVLWEAGRLCMGMLARMGFLRQRRLVGSSYGGQFDSMIFACLFFFGAKTP